MKSKVVDTSTVKKPTEFQVEIIKKLELDLGKRYLLFVDGKNLTIESAEELSELMYDYGYAVSIVLTYGEPKVSVVEDSGQQLPARSIKVENKEQS